MEFERIPSLMIKDRHGLYCSKSCHAKDSIAKKGEQIECICPICGKKFFVVPSRIECAKNIHCSQECAHTSLYRLKHHTKPEITFEEICTKYSLPFRFVGDGSFWIGGTPSLNPDFIHINKKKKVVIEIFGAYWHNNMLRNSGITYARTYKGRIKLFKERG